MANFDIPKQFSVDSQFDFSKSNGVTTKPTEDQNNNGGSAVAFDAKHGIGHIGKLLLQGQMNAEGSSSSSFSA